MSRGRRCAHLLHRAEKSYANSLRHRPEELPSAYVLAPIAATPDFVPMAGVFADIVASFRPEGV